MHDFNPDLTRLGDAEWMRWFHRLELLSRLAVVPRIPELSRQAQALEAMLKAGDSLFIMKLGHESFREWGAYTGLMLERDWRRPRQQINDLTFRSLLILSSGPEQDCLTVDIR